MKRRLFFGLAALFLIVALVLWQFRGRHPFAQLEASQIQGVEVRLIPPSVQYALTESQEAEFCLHLQNIVTYRTYSPEPMAGQFVEFTVTLEDGSIHTVQPFGDLITIDGISYRTAYTPSEALNAFANENIPA